VAASADFEGFVMDSVTVRQDFLHVLPLFPVPVPATYFIWYRDSSPIKPTEDV